MKQELVPYTFSFIIHITDSKTNSLTYISQVFSNVDHLANPNLKIDQCCFVPQVEGGGANEHIASSVGQGFKVVMTRGRRV
mmetsp:Transcript_13111/g.23516  ORF Transcript_13111/g.23516 Transcript_13111/m.23516 type:complete len:81 (+) Transcript_13111:112-354(+)